MSLKINELRVGNLVNNEHGTVLVNGSWFLFNIWETLEPIPLTKDWLLRFGFKETCIVFTLINDKTVFKLQYDDVCLFQIEAVEIEIKSVHQLQNLYFALTEKELECKV